MTRSPLLRFVPPLLVIALLLGGPTLNLPACRAAGETAAPRKAGENIYQGRILGVSQKAKTITIEVDGRPEMVRFDDRTEGLEHAVNNEAAVIRFEIRDGGKSAVVIKPVLAQLPAGVTEIAVEELTRLVALGPAAGNYFLADSRPASIYEKGHIPTAASIPLSTLEEPGEAAFPEDIRGKNTLLIFYCGGPTCGMSAKAAGLAKKMGYPNVRVFLQGEPAWKKAGNDLIASDEFVRTGNLVLLDVRPQSEVRKGHIPRAVNIPLAALAEAEAGFPRRKTAPIVIYGDSGDGRKAQTIISGWGYKKTALVNGGLQGYVSRGGELATGPAAREIVWKRKPGEGEVTAEDFVKAAAGSPGQIILDVRTDEEIAAGRFNNSLHIPLDQVETRIAELPRDKELLVHCATGARAQMAWQELRKAGLQSRFIVADVECKDGACELVEE